MMGAITQAFYDELAGDAVLVGLLSTYKGSPAIFTTDPRPGDSRLPCIVTAGEVINSPEDTKNCLGRVIWRDIRCYGPPSGSDAIVEDIGERVRAIFHRKIISILGYNVIISEVEGPIVMNEDNAQGRILTVKMTIKES